MVKVQLGISILYGKLCDSVLLANSSLFVLYVAVLNYNMMPSVFELKNWI